MKAAFGELQPRLLRMLWLDADEASYAANITVWLRWLFWVGAVIELAYQPTFAQAKYILFMLMHVPLVALNGYVHYRLLSRRRVTWRHLLALSAMDIVLITASVVVDGGFDTFLYIPYYPALAAFAAIFTSALLNLTWTTITASVYVGVSLTVGSGVAFDGANEKMLFSRVLAMFGVVLVVNLITRFQRRRARAAMERESALQRERIELSHAIHDTAAQTAFMIGLGIDAARQVAGDSNKELAARLDATARLSKTAVWQLRHPIDMGRIFEGSELGWTLDAHVATFGTITSVSAELTRTGWSRHFR